VIYITAFASKKRYQVCRTAARWFLPAIERMEEPRDVAMSGLLLFVQMPLRNCIPIFFQSANCGDRSEGWRRFSCRRDNTVRSIVIKASCPKRTFWIVTLEGKVINEPRRPIRGIRKARDTIWESMTDIDPLVRPVDDAVVTVT